MPDKSLLILKLLLLKALHCPAPLCEGIRGTYGMWEAVNFSASGIPWYREI